MLRKLVHEALCEMGDDDAATSFVQSLGMPDVIRLAHGLALVEDADLVDAVLDDDVVTHGEEA